MIYHVKYQAGIFSGTRIVSAADGQAALDECRRQIRKQMTLSMYADSYRIVDADHEEQEPKQEEE